ncbi:uncharacterized protein B0I36DRAFT_348806 [Microdochium trichocladiopsis]|uniref:Uncharacterized protein n=1 Tax=Microdochium trichocladiopsis TaxID=1682393 RepID=A0A9P8Y5A0_9PEZI|nr:uncharacterized protein B0I36DRAFT_348806 [Microdochium trichocladiopsis]KAH7030596.1 hypothetical protein B0I36DRAFT_348806 [Microdochium trichocladiopsis]
MELRAFWGRSLGKHGGLPACLPACLAATCLRAALARPHMSVTVPYVCASHPVVRQAHLSSDGPRSRDKTSRHPWIQAKKKKDKTLRRAGQRLRGPPSEFVLGEPLGAESGR